MKRHHLHAVLVRIRLAIAGVERHTAYYLPATYLLSTHYLPAYYLLTTHLTYIPITTLPPTTHLTYYLLIPYHLLPHPQTLKLKKH